VKYVMRNYFSDAPPMHEILPETPLGIYIQHDT